MAAFRVDADALRKQLREDRALRSSVTSLRSSAGSSAVKEYARPASRAHLESFDDLMKTAAQRCPPRPSTAPDPTLPRSLALWPAPARETGDNLYERGPARGGNHAQLGS